MKMENNVWYLLYCKSKQEQRAQDNLLNQGIDSFFPLFKMKKVVRKKRVMVDTALFPNYLFVSIDTEKDSFNSIRSTRGVIDFVKCKTAYTQVPAKLVACLKRAQVERDSSHECVTQLSAGDPVQINDGSFKHIDAIYKCADGLERSILLLNLLNQQKEVSMSNEHFRCIA